MSIISIITFILIRNCSTNTKLFGTDDNAKPKSQEIKETRIMETELYENTNEDNDNMEGRNNNQKSIEHESSSFLQNKENYLDFLREINLINKEAGQKESIIEYGEDSLIGIHYPLFEKEKIDKLTESFIDIQLAEFKAKIRDNKYLEENLFKAELNIDYETWLINERIVSIKYSIYVNMPNYPKPETGISTVIYDLKEQKKITSKDIMLENYLKKISQLTIKEFKLNPEYSGYVESDLFNTRTKPTLDNYSKFILKKDKIAFFFVKPELFPDMFGETVIEIPYDDLDGFMGNIINISSDKDAPITPIIDNSIKESERKLDPKKPMIALTFDDGPHSKNTISILNTLKENNAVATFFVLGNKVLGNKDALKKMIEGGNQIGNHSYDHKLLTALPKEELREQIQKTQNIVKEATGITPKVMRPTYGSYDEQFRQKIDLPIILWSIDTEDWKSKDAKKISDHVLKNVKEGSIILMHDIYSSTSDAVKIIVPELIKQGYQLVTISELYQYKGKGLDKGIVYREASYK